ncbi:MULTISPECIES: hypothetical protein [unclassified Streptosporangium]|uniref:hypothetical protein n=1 Tax=unclassified Streptosporangium TaxID=2632669 RepID=UPI002E2BCDEB|nr:MULTISPECIES: hypothetical protein [unclassified Streptosporangium]
MRASSLRRGHGRPPGPLRPLRGQTGHRLHDTGTSHARATRTVHAARAFRTAHATRAFRGEGEA